MIFECPHVDSQIVVCERSESSEFLGVDSFECYDSAAGGSNIRKGGQICDSVRSFELVSASQLPLNLDTVELLL